MQYHYSLYNQIQLSEEATHFNFVTTHAPVQLSREVYFEMILWKCTSGFQSEQSLHKQVHHKGFTFFDASMCD